MTEKRIKIKIDKNGNFDIEATKGFTNNECHNTVEAIIGGIDVKEIDREDRREKFEEPNLIANLK